MCERAIDLRAIGDERVESESEIGLAARQERKLRSNLLRLGDVPWVERCRRRCGRRERRGGEGGRRGHLIGVG